MKIKNCFAELLDEAEIPVAIVGDAVTGTAAQTGDATGLGAGDLVRALFGDAECIRATLRSLDGQMIPRIWSQGNVTCVVCRPTDTVLVGLFCVSTRDPVQLYHWAKQLNSKVELCWRVQQGLLADEAG